MSDDSGSTIQDRYAQRFAADLETNLSEQEGVRAQIADLQGRLDQLAQEQTWLSAARGTLATGSEAPSAADPARDNGNAPAPTSKEDKPQGIPRARRAKKSAAAKKPKSAAVAETAVPAATRTAKGSAAAAGRRKAAPVKPKNTDSTPLIDLVLSLLSRHHEPRQASEVAEELKQLHPERPTSIQVVRNSLEALVAKGKLVRERQRRSVFYTAPAAGAGADAGAGGASAEPEASASSDAPSEVAVEAGV